MTNNVENVLKLTLLISTLLIILSFSLIRRYLRTHGLAKSGQAGGGVLKVLPPNMAVIPTQKS